MDVVDAIISRRSIGRVSPDLVPHNLIEQLLRAAVAAPNHHESEPWRFFVLDGSARDALGDALAESLRRRRPDLESGRLEALCTAERLKPLRAPTLIVVATKRSENPRVRAVEDLQACSAAIQNILLAAHGLGLAAIWRTGEGAYDNNVKAHFGLSPEDQIAGFAYIGLPAEGNDTPLRPRVRSYESFTEWRTAETP
jgi:nitroreductase